MSRTKVYDRIPPNAYEADRMMGARRQVKLGHETRLVRVMGTIVLMYWSTPIVTYHPDGAVSFRTDGWFTQTTINRMRRALPVDWTIARPRRGMRRPTLMYRDVYSVGLADNTRLLPNGDVRVGNAYTLTRANLDDEVQAVLNEEGD